MSDKEVMAILVTPLEFNCCGNIIKQTLVYQIKPMDF